MALLVCRTPWTPREAMVARLVVAGARYRAIAARLGIAPSTVAMHVVNAADKLSGSYRTLSPRGRLVVYAQQARAARGLGER